MASTEQRVTPECLADLATEIANIAKVAGFMASYAERPDVQRTARTLEQRLKKVTKKLTDLQEPET